MSLLIIGQSLSRWVTLPGVNDDIVRVPRWNNPHSAKAVIPEHVNRRV
ncbi:MAG: hypothetical protein Q8P51_15215 [Ignavibacteria bacterium]|nr:hypothetical protein [Ignavibacteria bacterium]